MGSVSGTAARITGLDGLRGAAALGVALYHFSIAHPNAEAFFPAACIWGRYGVNLFFMISGFVMFMTLAKIRRPMDFAVSRFSRLYPAYWACVILTFLATRLPDVRVPRAGWGTFLANLTMFQGFFGADLVDSSYWTLRVELCFYLALFLVYVCGGLRRINPILLGQLALAFGYWKFRDILPERDPAFEAAIDPFILPYAPYFAAGIVLYKLAIAGERRVASNYLVLGLAFFLMRHKLPWPAFALHAGFAAVLYLVGAGRAGWLASRPMVLLGLVSYPFYLIHQYVGFMLLDRLAVLGIPVAFAIPAVLAGCLGLAAALHRWVEKPMQAAIRDRYRARAAAVPPPIAGAAATLPPAAR